MAGKPLRRPRKLTALVDRGISPAKSADAAWIVETVKVKPRSSPYPNGPVRRGLLAHVGDSPEED